MPKRCFTPWSPRPTSEKVIDQANEIIEAYQAEGYTLTLRQLYYRFVAADLIPNTLNSYNRLGNIVGKARLAGFIDWNAIEDRGRNLMGYRHFDDPGEALEEAASRYHIDLWEGQKHHVEVWVEKQALESVIGRAANKWDARYLACKGYMSLSELYDAANRFASYREAGRTPVVIHLGDHDPSGIDMTRDIFDRLNETFGVEVEVDRIALNMNQVRKHRPPPNPAKMTDSRFKAYVTNYGRKSWELDALEPKTLARLIDKAIKARLDVETFEERRRLQGEHRDEMRRVAQTWGDEEE